MRIPLIVCLAAMPAIPAYAQKLPTPPLVAPPLIAPPIVVPGVVVTTPSAPGHKGKGWAKGHANKSVKGQVHGARSAGKGW